MAKKTEPETKPVAPVAPKAEEKVISDALLEELKKAVEENPTESVEVIIPNSTEKVMRIPISTLFPQSGRLPEKKDEKAGSTPAAPTAPTAATLTTPAITSSTTSTPLAEKKVSRSFFSLFHFPKKEPKVAVETPAAPVKIAAPETQQLTNEALLKEIDSKMKTISGDEFIVIKISKQALLILFGVLLLLIWMLPIFTSLQKSLFSRFTPKQPEIAVVASPEPSAIPVPPTKIRVRMESESADDAAKVKVLLTEAGFTSIEVVTDTQINTKTVLIVTRDGSGDLRQKLTQVFDKQYMVASESATLTEDSDFVASILVGKNALIQ